MSLLDTVLGKHNTEMLVQLAHSVGIDQNQAREAVRQLLPALSRAIKSNNVAAHAAQQTGTDTDIVKRLLPLVAAMVMGALSKQTANKTLSADSAQSYRQADAEPTHNWITSFLDADKDGDISDDLLNLAKRFF